VRRKGNYRVGPPPGSGSVGRTGSALRPAIGRALVDAALTAAAAALVAGLFFLGRGALEKLRASDTFRVHTVIVEGNRRFTREQILAGAGLDGSPSIFDVSPEAVRRRMEKNAWIRTVDVKRVFPDAVKVTVEERAMAADLLVGGSVYHVDAEGTLFEKHPEGAPIEGVLLTGFDEEGLTGARDAVEEEIRRLIQFAALYRKVGLDRHAPIGELHRESGGEIAVYRAGTGGEIRFGTSGFLRKMKNVRAILEFLARERKEWVYILADSDSFPDRIVTKLAP